MPLAQVVRRKALNVFGHRRSTNADRLCDHARARLAHIPAEPFEPSASTISRRASDLLLLNRKKGRPFPAQIADNGPRLTLSRVAAFDGTGWPWQNGFAEWLIGSIQRESVEHMIVLGDPHLRCIPKSYARYYNDVRTHRSSNEDVPVSRSVQRAGVIRTLSLAGFIPL